MTTYHVILLGHPGEKVKTLLEDNTNKLSGKFRYSPHNGEDEFIFYPPDVEDNVDIADEDKVIGLYLYNFKDLMIPETIKNEVDKFKGKFQNAKIFLGGTTDSPVYTNVQATLNVIRSKVNVFEQGNIDLTGTIADNSLQDDLIPTLMGSNGNENSMQPGFPSIQIDILSSKQTILDAGENLGLAIEPPGFIKKHLKVILGCTLGFAGAGAAVGAGIGIGMAVTASIPTFGISFLASWVAIPIVAGAGAVVGAVLGLAVGLAIACYQDRKPVRSGFFERPVVEQQSGGVIVGSDGPVPAHLLDVGSDDEIHKAPKGADDDSPPAFPLFFDTEFRI